MIYAMSRDTDTRIGEPIQVDEGKTFSFPLDSLTSLKSHSLLDYAFSVISTLKKEGVVPLPRYKEFSPWTLRLMKTEYKRCDSHLLKIKLLLHLDSYMYVASERVLNLRGLSSGMPHEVALSLLRVTLKVIIGANPPRFRYKPKVVPEMSDADRVLHANLECNRFLSKDPDSHGPDYIDRDIDLHNVLDIVKPSLDDLRFVNRHDANLTRKRLGYGPKPYAAGYTDDDIFRLKSIVDKSNLILDRFRPVFLEPLFLWRKYHLPVLFDSGMISMEPVALLSIAKKIYGELHPSFEGG